MLEPWEFKWLDTTFSNGQKVPKTSLQEVVGRRKCLGLEMANEKLVVFFAMLLYRLGWIYGDASWCIMVFLVSISFFRVVCCCGCWWPWTDAAKPCFQKVRTPANSQPMKSVKGSNIILIRKRVTLSPTIYKHPSQTQHIRHWSVQILGFVDRCWLSHDSQWVPLVCCLRKIGPTFSSRIRVVWMGPQVVPGGRRIMSSWWRVDPCEVNSQHVHQQFEKQHLLKLFHPVWKSLNINENSLVNWHMVKWRRQPPKRSPRSSESSALGGPRWQCL